MNRLAATAAGCALFTLPFLQSGYGETHSHGPGPHMDHEPRHGGVLLMLGDYHVEVVEGRQQIELYLSDSERRPLKPSAIEARYDGRREGEAGWDSYRSVTATPPGFRTAEFRILLDPDTVLELDWPPAGRAAATPAHLHPEAR